jgi:predicted DNA-binding protein
MKHIKNYTQLKESLNKGLSMDAVYIHQITGSGHKAAQNFIDDNNIDGKKLADYIKQNQDTIEKYNVRDIIAGTGVGANKSYVKRFIKQFLNEAKEFKVKDLQVGAILNFKDGETWKVTKIIGNLNNPRGYLAAPHGETKKDYVSLAIEFKLDQLEDELVSIDEATTSWSRMMKDVKTGSSGPWSIVAHDNKRVVAQEIDIRDKNLLPAKYEGLAREYPKAKFHIEDSTGHVVWSENNPKQRK